MRRSQQCNHTNDQASPHFDLSSLIDISFLLLIYFLATSTLEQRESDLGLTLSGRLDGVSDVTIDQLVVDVMANGSIEIAAETVDDSRSEQRNLPGLLDRLALYKASALVMGHAPVVVIRAADKSRGQRFVDVINCVAGERIENVTLAEFQTRPVGD
jgi:biopolymer transport protein ExbD